MECQCIEQTSAQRQNLEEIGNQLGESILNLGKHYNLCSRGLLFVVSRAMIVVMLNTGTSNVDVMARQLKSMVDSSVRNMKRKIN